MAGTVELHVTVDFLSGFLLVVERAVLKYPRIIVNLSVSLCGVLSFDSHISDVRAPPYVLLVQCWAGGQHLGLSCQDGISVLSLPLASLTPP